MQLKSNGLTLQRNMLLYFAVEVALNSGRFDFLSCLASVQER